MKRIAVTGMLVALSLIFSYLERLIPVTGFIPLPGVKLGLANIVTIVALFYIDLKTAAAVTALRCVMANLLFGSLVSMIYSLCGAMLALFIMVLLKSGYNRFFSVIGISAAGAAAHNTGQIIAATVILNSPAVMAYLPVLLVASVVTGFAIGLTAENVLRIMGTGKWKTA